MKTAFTSQCVPGYRLLTQDQIGKIHGATLELLQTTGVKVLNAAALQLLKSAGCTIADEQIVKIPDRLVEDGLINQSMLGAARISPVDQASPVDFVRVAATKRRLLDQAYERFTNGAGTSELRDGFATCSWWPPRSPSPRNMRSA